MAVALGVEGVSAGYGRGDIVRDIAFSLESGRIAAVLGPNGSGKSTLVKALAGLLPARRGRILLDGVDITGLDAPGRARAGLAYVPQEANIFRNLSVDENLRLSVEFLSDARGEEGDGRRRVFALFPDLSSRLNVLAGNLSGGQRQMLAFGAALMSRPRVLLLDEPSAGLSPRYVEDMLKTVRRVNRTGVSVLMVEQNVKAALRIADDAVVMVAGEVRLVEAAAEVAASRDVHRLFLGAGR